MLDPWEAQSHLHTLLNGPRFGVIEGVTFDFRSCDLPKPDTWHAPEGGRPFGLAFPWDRRFCGGDPEQAARFVTDYGSEASAVTHVYSGDTVSVGRVKQFWRGNGKPPYVHPSDCYEMWASLNVTRPDGATVSTGQWISFNSRDAMGPHSVQYSDAELEELDHWSDGYAAFVGDFRISFEKIGMRINRLKGEALENSSNEWSELADDTWGRAVEYLEGGIFLPEMQALLDLASAAGYALAKAEAMPLIESKKNQTKPATLARRVRGDPVRDEALRDIRAHPRTSQTACAARVAALLSRDQRAVERMIAGFFGWADLPGGTREKRPHRHLLPPTATAD